jgi:SulP family sulfate permease
MERIPWSVTEGFTLGIALVIALQQLPLVYQVPRGEGTETLVVAWGTINNAVTMGINWISVAVVLATLTIKFVWSAIMHRMKWRFTIPASALAVVVMTALCTVLNLPIARIGALPASDIFHFSFNWPDVNIGPLIYAATVIAFLGAIESLLSARVADSMAESRDKTEHPLHAPNRELFGQGMASLASAFVGGMPATGAIARSGVNIHAGAQTRLAAAVHALALALLVFGLGSLVALVPTAVLAGVLLGTSWRIASPRSIAEAMRTTTLNKLTFIVTAIAVVGIDLIWGTVIGVLFHVAGSAIGKKRAPKLSE